MHKTILFLFAFLITPITASYAVDSTTPCNERPCEVKAEEIEGKEYDFVCKWIKKSNGATPTNGVISGNCQKKWYCKKDDYYIKVHTKTINNGTAFSHVSCEACPPACREGDDGCIKKAEHKNNVTTIHATNDEELGNYSPAQSVNDCYLKILAPAAENEITGSDEIGYFRTKKSDNPFICPY